MVPVPSETAPSPQSDNTTEMIKPDYCRQISLKRHNSDDDPQIDIDEIRCKRGRILSHADGTIICPMADFGCLRDIPHDKLQEHYTSQIHQQCLLKAIDFYSYQASSESKSNTSTISENVENSNEILNSLDILADGVSCLHDHNIQIQSDVTQLKRTIIEQQKQLEQLKILVEENQQLMHAAQINSTIFQTELETNKEMITDLSCRTSNDGSFVWKITNLAQKISDAIAERQTSIYSPPFYSSPTGYKMCMRLYINGDGQARKTHLSLFFVIMRGEYDAILQWPFTYKITFCLFDQTGNQRHIIDSFRPDAKSNSFQRPRTDMNIASGIPKFCPLTIIHQANNSYVHDDCMFIRCMVDFGAIPKTMLPFICSMNPGLPKTIQQKMYEAELDRRNSIATEVKDASPEKVDSK